MTEPSLSLRDRVDSHVAGQLARLSPRAQLMLAGVRPVRIDGEELDPGIQLMLAAARLLRGGASLTRSARPDTSPAKVRLATRREALVAARYRTPIGAVTELEVEGDSGRLPARHYAPPAPGGPHPLLLFLHGGGWTIGDLETHDEPCRLLCRHGGLHVLSVEYRLAPEHPFPAAVEDAFAALRWSLEHAEALGADPCRVAVGGDSAGGNLAAVASQLRAGAGDPGPALQVLIYPATDFSRRRRSADLFAHGFFLDEADRTWCEAKYLDGTGADRADPRLSPLCAPSLSGLPPAIVITAAFDPLRDEGEAYAAALEAAGVSVTLRRVPGLIHGFLNMTGISRAARVATVELAETVGQALAAPA